LLFLFAAIHRKFYFSLNKAVSHTCYAFFVHVRALEGLSVCDREALCLEPTWEVALVVEVCTYVLELGVVLLGTLDLLNMRLPLSVAVFFCKLGVKPIFIHLHHISIFINSYHFLLLYGSLRVRWHSLNYSYHAQGAWFKGSFIIWRLVFIALCAFSIVKLLNWGLLPSLLGN
jgi:hypothetical protein